MESFWDPSVTHRLAPTVFLVISPGGSRRIQEKGEGSWTNSNVPVLRTHGSFVTADPPLHQDHPL